MVVNMLSLRGLEPTNVHRVFKEKRRQHDKHQAKSQAKEKG